MTAAQARRVATAKITRDPRTSIARASARSCSSPQAAVLIAGFQMTPRAHALRGRRPIERPQAPGRPLDAPRATARRRSTSAAGLAAIGVDQQHVIIGTRALHTLPHMHRGADRLGLRGLQNPRLTDGRDALSRLSNGAHRASDLPRNALLCEALASTGEEPASRRGCRTNLRGRQMLCDCHKTARFELSRFGLGRRAQTT